MQRTITDPDCNHFRLFLIEPCSRTVLARRDGERWVLPRANIPRWSRIAPNILSKIRGQLGIQAIVLDELDALAHDSLILAEVIDRPQSGNDSSFSWKNLRDLATDEFVGEELRTVRALVFEGTTGRGQFSRLGWFSEVLSWTASHTDVATKQFVEIKQVNAASSSTLIRFATENGFAVWFKAVADPSMIEYRVTVKLREYFPDYLPTLLATHDVWHAWLMEDAGRPLDEMENARPRLFEEVARHLAELQKASIPKAASLLVQGCADLRLSALRARMPAIMASLEEAVEIPDYGSHTYLRKARIRALHQIFKDAADQLQASSIPDTLVHSDVSTENILIGDGTCVFADWAEAAVGNPMANFEQLRIQVAQHHNAAAVHGRLLAAYMRTWSSQLSDSQIRKAFMSTPPVAIAMYLNTRRDWLTPEKLREPEFVRYARAMARQMDRAVREYEAREALTA